MESLAKTLSNLEVRRETVARELARIDERLAAIATLLNGKSAEATQPKPNHSFSSTVTKRRETTRRSWFERDEATQLLRKAAKTVKPASELVRRVAALKGYTDKLSVDEMRRFQGAAYMAINHAVKVGALKRQKGGGYQAA